jgi:hypothetical protein
MNLYKIIGTSLAAFLFLTQTACLKDKAGTTDVKAGTNNVVEFQNSSIPVSYTSIYPQYNNSLLWNPDTSGFNINFNYTGAEAVTPQDIKITIAIDTAALSAFNADQSAGYVLPPTDAYSFATTVTIAKGTRQATIYVNVTLTSDWDYNADYALPLTITSASYGTVSSNFGTAIYSVSGRNKYDGSYSLREKTTGWGAYSIDDGTTYDWPNNIGFVTAGANSNTTSDKTEGALLLAFSPTGGATGFGATTPEFTFDPTSNTLTSVTNTTPSDGRGRTLTLNPAVTDSRYDPATKTIYAAFIMTQVGPTSARPEAQYFYDTLVYKGTR